MTRYVGMVLGGAISFGILSSFVKLAYGLGYSAAELSFLQALIGAVVLWGLSLLTSPSKTSHRDIGALLLCGSAIGMATYFYYLSIHYIPASVSIVLLMQFTWLSLLLEWIVFKRKPLALEMMIAGLILSGTVLASGLTGQMGSMLSVKGIGIVLLASLAYAIYIIANSRVGKGVAWQSKSAWTMTGSAFSIFLLNSHSIITDGHWTNGLMHWGLFLAFFGTILPPVLFAIGIPKVGASTSSLLMTVELPVAVVTAYLVLREPITLIQSTGILVMVIAIIAMTIVQQRNAKRALPSL